jgi:hypothetical protein
MNDLDVARFTPPVMNIIAKACPILLRGGGRNILYIKSAAIPRGSAGAVRCRSHHGSLWIQGQSGDEYE